MRFWKGFLQNSGICFSNILEMLQPFFISKFLSMYLPSLFGFGTLVERRGTFDDLNTSAKFEMRVALRWGKEFVFNEINRILVPFKMSEHLLDSREHWHEIGVVTLHHCFTIWSTRVTIMTHEYFKSSNRGRSKMILWLRSHLIFYKKCIQKTKKESCTLRWWQEYSFSK